jgi:hypothetical protein
MAKSAQAVLKSLALERWHAALPGVPDDQIVLPRFSAFQFAWFPAAPHGQDHPFVWEHIEMWMDLMVRYWHQTGSGRNERARKSVQNLLRRAERWWDSLPKLTPLLLNQRLFTHRDSWREAGDLQEFFICQALCLAWLNLPKKRRSAAAAKQCVQKILREMRDRVEAGMPPPKITPIGDRSE